MASGMTLVKRALLFGWAVATLAPVIACTPIGDANGVGSSYGSNGVNPLPGPGPAPAPAPAPAPGGINCATVKAPTITGSAPAATLNGTIGLGTGSGNQMPAQFFVPYTKGYANQVINQNCSISAPLNGNVAVNCNAQADGQLRVTLNVQNNVECVSGTATVTLRIRDDVCRAEAVSNSVTFQLAVADACPAQQQIRKDGSIPTELTAERLDQFGSHVVIAGNTAVVTALSDNQKANNAGAAFVYNFNGTSWIYKQKLMPAQLVASSEVDSVAVAGNLIVLGAPYHGSYGGIFVYRYNGSSWVQSQGLIEPSLKNSAVLTENFGYDIAISGSNVYVGAPGYYHADPINFAKAGAVFVFSDNGSTLSETRVISASDKASGDAFGAAVAALGSQLVVGAPGNGKAYLFSGSGYTETKLVSNLPANSRFGTSAAITSSRIAIGAPGALNAQNEGSGGVVAFDTAGARKQTLFGADSGIQFGLSIAANGTDLLVGTPTASINGATRSGSAHLYRLDGSGNYQPYFIFRPRKAQQGFEDYFGESISLGNGFVLGGARADDLADSDMGSAFFIRVP